MEIGCKLRNLCMAYQVKDVYQDSPILSSDFFRVCDTAPSETFPDGFCPLYDTYSKVIDLMQQTLRTANDSLNRTLEGLSKNHKN